MASCCLSTCKTQGGQADGEQVSSTHGQGAGRCRRNKAKFRQQRRLERMPAAVQQLWPLPAHHWSAAIPVLPGRVRWAETCLSACMPGEGCQQTGAWLLPCLCQQPLCPTQRLHNHALFACLLPAQSPSACPNTPCSCLPTHRHCLLNFGVQRRGILQQQEQLCTAHGGMQGARRGPKRAHSREQKRAA